MKEDSMKKLLGTTLLAALSAACVPGVAMAEEGMTARFSGFGTIGAVRTNTDDVNFVASARQSHGVGRGWDLGVDSRLGVQANVEFNSTFSAVGQLLASRREGSEEPVVEWLYAQAKVAPWLDLRVGRMVLPVFLVSDSRNVGYSTHWLRAPGDVYALYPSSYYDGLQANTRYALGGGNISANLSAGRAKSQIYPTALGIVQIHMPKIRSLNVVYELGDWTMRFGRTLANNGYLNFPIQGFSAPTSDAFNGVGGQYDNGKLLVMGEYTTRRQPDRGADSDAGYLTGGYRFGSVMPYATISRIDPKGFLYGGQPAANSSAYGVRWDAFTNVALKAQYDRVGNQSLMLGNPAALGPNGRLHVLSLSADFVF